MNTNQVYPINCYDCGRLITYSVDPKIRTAQCIICQQVANPTNLPTLPLPEFQPPVPATTDIVIPELQTIADKEFGAGPEPLPAPEEKPKTKTSTIKKILSGKKLVPGKKKRK